MAQLQIEVYVSLDGEKFTKIDLTKKESINMKYIYKDTTDLSKIFSPYSQSFTFAGTLNNQRAFNFVGNTKVLKTKSNNVFACKMLCNGLLFQTGKLKVTEIREEFGRVKSFTANFTTSLLSLQTRMGSDLINDLPVNKVKLNWVANDVYNYLGSTSVHPTEPMEGIKVKFYVPLISNNRVFQRDASSNVFSLDNVYYNSRATQSTAFSYEKNVILTDELSPAIQGRAIMDMIKKKYSLDIIMPIEDEAYYNDWYVYCNGATEENAIDFVEFDIKNQFTAMEYHNRKKLTGNIVKYDISAELATNLLTVTRTPTYASEFSKSFYLTVNLNTISGTKTNSDLKISFAMLLENGDIRYQDSAEVVNGVCSIKFEVPDAEFQGTNSFKFKLQIKPSAPIVWGDSEVLMEYEFHDGKFGPFNSTAHVDIKKRSVLNYNSDSMSSSSIDLFKAIPETKCVDFLISFFKTFNISVFDASPDDDKLYWLTPNDLLTENKPYSKKEVDYTEYLTSLNIDKSIANDYNYYNLKHKTSKYKSAVDYLTARGYEFGQLTYPTVKPTEDLNEFKVETGFCLLESVPIAGMTDEFTSYAFTSDAPTVLDTGEKRYKPNTEDLTIFFNAGLRTLTGDKRLGFKTTTSGNGNNLTPITSYIKTSAVHSSGFSFGFGLIQESVLKSLYYYFYKTQTERFLNPNTLQQAFTLQLPASELVLNYANELAGQSLIPNGFRLQNEVIIQEQRFTIVDATIDITTGKTKLNLLNF